MNSNQRIFVDVFELTNSKYLILKADLTSVYIFGLRKKLTFIHVPVIIQLLNCVEYDGGLTAAFYKMHQFGKLVTYQKVITGLEMLPMLPMPMKCSVHCTSEITRFAAQTGESGSGRTAFRKVCFSYQQS